MKTHGSITGSMKLFLFIFSVFFFSGNISFAHCDTMDGPLIKDVKTSIDKNNINYVLKWVQPQYESEIGNAYNLMMKVRGYSPESRQLAEAYFFETLVRLHRSGEGVAFTGVKPSGTPVDEKILAADKSIEAGSLSPLEGMVNQKEMPELKERFERVMLLKNYNPDDVNAGREYIEAYVQFFKFAEGEEDHATTAHEHGTSTANHAAHLPWILSIFFFVTTAFFGVMYFRRR